MSNSEQNKNWKQELEQIELHSSDLSFEKTAAWDKLYQRLEKPESKKRVGWFKWAAVFVALTSLLSYFIISKSPSASNEPSITVTKTKTNESIFNSNSKEPGSLNETVVENKSGNNEPSPKHEEISNRRKPIEAIPVSETEMAQLSPFSFDSPNSISITAPAADTFRNITIVSQPEKRKLRVIHINDYAVPVKPTSMMVNAENNSLNILRFHYLSPSEVENTSSNTPPAPPLLKIKITPQN